MLVIEIEPARDGGFIVYEAGAPGAYRPPLFAGDGNATGEYLERWLRSAHSRNGSEPVQISERPTLSLSGFNVPAG